MSDATKAMRDFLTKSPSVVFPDEVMELFVPVEKENETLRELVRDVHEALCADKAGMFHKLILASMEDDMRELGIEVNG